MNKKEKITEYLNGIYQNTKTAIQSIEDILPKVKCKNLKDELIREQSIYYSLARDCETFARKNKIDNLKDNNWMEKAKLCMSVNMSTMMNRSTRKIAELMLLGTFMGIITCYKDQDDHKNLSKELDEIIKKLKESERDNIQILLPYLSENNSNKNEINNKKNKN